LVWNCLELWCGSCWLLNHFFNEKEEKLKLKKLLEFGGNSWCPWEALDKSDLIEFISQFSELRCAFWSGRSCWKFKKIAKIGFKRKNPLSCQCVHFAEFKRISIMKMWKNKKCVQTWAKGTGYNSVLEDILLYALHIIGPLG